MKKTQRTFVFIIALFLLFVSVIFVSARINYEKTIADEIEQKEEGTTITYVNHRQEIDELRKEVRELRFTTKEIKETSEIVTELETESVTESQIDFEIEKEKVEEKTEIADTNDDEFGTYIGEFRITWYSSEELIRQGFGSPDGHTTASGRWAQESHTIAMNNEQRRSLGITYGTRLYIEGMGEFVVEDCGCSWGTIDRFFEYNPSEYEWPNNPHRDVWIIG